MFVTVGTNEKKNLSTSHFIYIGLGSILLLKFKQAESVQLYYCKT